MSEKVSGQISRNERVRRAGGDTQIVFEDVPRPVVGLDKVDARDMAEDIGRGYDALALREIAF